MLLRTGTGTTNMDTVRTQKRTQNVDTRSVHGRKANAGGAAGRAVGDAAAGAAAGPPLGQLYGILFYLL